MNVLIACEESQTVCKAFLAKGHNAFSCDLQECSGGLPERHIHGDCLKVLKAGNIQTQSGKSFFVDYWDLMIAHPPCTYFSTATNANMKRESFLSHFYTDRDLAFKFVLDLWNAPIEHICIENVRGYLNTHFMKPSQIIQPYYFGDPYMKTTCLWLKNLPLVISDNYIVPKCRYVRHNKSKYDVLMNRKGVYGGKLRSKTFPGVARAMADQWSDLCNIDYQLVFDI